MISFWLRCQKNTESKKPEVVKTKKGRMVVTSSFVRFLTLKNQDLLNSKKLVKYYLTGMKVQVLSDLPIASILF